MHLPVSAQVVSDLWAAIEKPESISSFRRRCISETPQILREAGGAGWTGVLEANTVLGTAGIYAAGSAGRILAEFGLTPEMAYRRPVRGRAEAIGAERIPAANLARAAILLERTGIPIDPSPICEALRSGLKARAYLTEPELAAYWHSRERERCEPLLVTVPSCPRLFEEIQADADMRVTTAAGYRVDVWFTEYDPPEPYAIRIEAPRWRGSRRFGIPLAA